LRYPDGDGGVSSRAFDQKGNLMARYEHSIDVNVPLETAYNQWTQFEEFPKFMEGVKRVEQQGDTHLHWTAEIAGQERQWEAEITEQKPDARIAWHSTTGAKNAGVVTFHYIDRDKTRVMLQMEYDPEGFVENVGAALGVVQRRITGDLERFKDFIEAKGFETGAWRGEVERFSNTEPMIGGGSRYTEPSEATETRIPTTPTFYDATSNGSEDPATSAPVQRITKESRSFMGQDSNSPGIEQDSGYGKAEERGQRSVLGDDTFISSGEGDGTNNGGGGIPSTEGRPRVQSTYGGSAGGQARDETGRTASATGSDPRLYNEDISHGVAPGEDPSRAHGAVEEEPQGEGWEDDPVRNPPASL
jgi:uncharacterized membrane protein